MAEQPAALKTVWVRQLKILVFGLYAVIVMSLNWFIDTLAVMYSISAHIILLRCNAAGFGKMSFVVNPEL